MCRKAIIRRQDKTRQDDDDNDDDDDEDEDDGDDDGDDDDNDEDDDDDDDNYDIISLIPISSIVTYYYKLLYTGKLISVKPVCSGHPRD